MLKKILISALIAIGLVSGSVVRGQNTGGDKGQSQTTNEKRGRRRPTEFTSFTHIKEKRGRRRGFRKKGGEQERPLNPQPLPPGKHARRRGHRRH